MFKSLSILASSMLVISPLYALDLQGPKEDLTAALTIPLITPPSYTARTLNSVIAQIGLKEKVSKPAPKPVDIAAIQKYSGFRPIIYTEKACRINCLRSDLHKVIMVTPNKLTSWAEFKRDGNGILLNGRLVITQNQINPLIDLLLTNHLNVVGLYSGNQTHNVFYLKFEGKGTEKDLAMTVSKAFNLLKQGDKSEEFPLAILEKENTTFNTHLIDRLMGSRGELEEGIYYIKARQGKHAAAKSRSEIQFSGSNELAAVEGDMVLNQAQLKNVLPVLHKAGIEITSIKETSLPNDQNVEIHYYGVGKVAGLARGVHNALNILES